MIVIMLNLICDGCKAPFKGGPQRHMNTVFRRDIEALRIKAKGWSRYRRANNESMGDYCPACDTAFQEGARQKARLMQPSSPGPYTTTALYQTARTSSMIFLCPHDPITCRPARHMHSPPSSAMPESTRPVRTCCRGASTPCAGHWPGSWRSNVASRSFPGLITWGPSCLPRARNRGFNSPRTVTMGTAPGRNPGGKSKRRGSSLSID
jgi:hypothetical protein